MAGAVRQKGWAEHEEHDQQNEKFSSNPVAFVFTLMDEKKKTNTILSVQKYSS
jgi:hypothetical protein